MGRSIFDPKSRLFDPSVAQAVQQSTSQSGPHLDPSRPVTDFKMHAGMLLDAYFDPPDPYTTFLDLGGKVDFRPPKSDFLTPLSYRPHSSQICQLGPHLDPSRPVPDFKMHAGMLLDAHFDPPTNI